MNAASKFLGECKLTDREDMLQLLRKWYSVEQSHSILQIVSEGNVYEDDHIQILKGFFDSNMFYYVLKRIIE